jgi:hypothetical protein
MNPSTVYTIDWSQVAAEVIKGLQDGSMKLSMSNGNVYNAAGSGKTGIVAQLPFVESQAVNPEQLLQMANALQSTVVVAAAVSTAVIIGAIVIQTAYLARKLDKLQQSVDAVGHDVHLQSVVGYMHRITDYFGAVEAARQMISDRALVDEVAFVAPAVLADLAIRRNGLCSLVERLLVLAEEGVAGDAPHRVSEAQYQLILSFAIEALANLPAGLYLERELYAFVGKYQLAEHVGRESKARYRTALESLKSWSNRQMREAVKGRRGSQGIMAADAQLRSLFDNDPNEMLLGSFAPARSRTTPPGATQAPEQRRNGDDEMAASA